MTEIGTLHGTQDYCGEDMLRRNNIMSRARNIFLGCGFSEVSTPIIEKAEVFDRNLGKSSDIVEKEMYAFKDNGGRYVALRPEGTSGVARAILDRGTGVEGVRVFYMGEMFRGERPAKGRSREFTQIGVESFGEANPWADAEVVSMAADFLTTIGVKDFKIKVNTKGFIEESEAVCKALKDYFTPLKDILCPDCRRRLAFNPWRILDCKNCGAILEKAPKPLDLVCDESKRYFEAFCHALDEMEIKYEYDPLLVRGLDYYAHTVFEIVCPSLGNLAIGGGGRYRLAFQGTDKTVDGVGFACGLERIVLAGGGDVRNTTETEIMVIGTGKEANGMALKVAHHLRNTSLNWDSFRTNEIRIAVDCSDKSLKSKMRRANKMGAKIVLICDEHEAMKKIGRKVCFKDMSNSNQMMVKLDDIVHHVQYWFHEEYPCGY